MPRRLPSVLTHWLGIEHSPVSHAERLLSGIGGCLGIAVILLVCRDLSLHAQLLTIASMGASAVLLFAVPHGALSQPWPTLGGHLISALIGVTCYRWIPSPLLAAALAVGVSISLMHYLRCLHPPGGATALIAVIGGDEIHALGYAYLWFPVGINLLLIMATAVLFNAPFAWRRYPVSWARRGQPQAPPTTPLRHEDFEAALREIDSFIDVDEEDLQRIFTLAEQHAQQRQRSSRGARRSRS